MKLIALEKEVEGTRAEDFQPFLEEEARKVWELYKTGIIRETYFRADQTCAVLIMECRDLEEARQAISSLPLVREKLIEFDIIPLVPYPGLERLFKPV